MMINQQHHVTFTHHHQKLMVTIMFILIQSVQPQTPRPSCGSQEAYYANPEDCRSYYYCWNNENYLQYCPNGLYFHLAGRTCEPPGVADCGGYTSPGGGFTTSKPGGGGFGSSLCTKICNETELAKKSPVKGVLYAICKCTESMTITSTIKPSYAASMPLTTPAPPNVFSIISNFFNSIFPGVR